MDGVLKYGSLFAGIGGFDLGLDRAGMSCRWQVEINPFATKVLERHWPEVKRYGDITTIDPRELEPVDLICGGFPCQDLSTVGQRAGLAGTRSGLFWEVIRLLADLHPRWVIIENVPGLLSSNGGRDMGTVLGALGELGYGWAYRVLDAQYFGVAQRRKRVFIVANSRDRFAPAHVLLEPESGQRNPPQKLQEGQVIATLLASGAGTNRAAGIASEADFLVLDGGRVRRLTPLEAERLQGFPDNWTRLDDSTPDSPRYKAIGNAVAVPVAAWIAKRIIAYEPTTTPATHPGAIPTPYPIPQYPRINLDPFLSL